MNKKYLLIPLIFLIGLLHADLLCIHSYPVNQGGWMNIHCATQPSESECIANTSDQEGNFIMQYPEYPPLMLEELKTPLITSKDGQFTIKMFMNDKVYFNGYNYSATITCFNPLDNSTNQTSFEFSPETYASNAGWFIGILIWLQKEFMILAFIGILSMFAIILIMFFFRAMKGG